MRKLIICLFLLLIIIGCKKHEYGNAEIIPSKYDSIVDYYFIKNNSNYMENYIVRQDAIEQFVPTFDSLINYNKVADFVFKVLSIDKTKNDTIYSLNLYVYSSISYLKPQLKFNLIGLVHKSIATQINESEYYRIYANDFSRLSDKELFNRARLVYFENIPNIDVNSMNSKEFYLGSFLCNIDSLRSVNKQKVIN